MYNYKCFEEKMFHEDIGEYTSYGIKLDGTDMKIDDVSVDKSFVEGIVFKMNKYQAEPVHMADIIEDMLE